MPIGHVFAAGGSIAETPGQRRARTVRHVLALLLLTAAVFLPGLDNYGVYGWQEGQRLLVAQQMDARLRASVTVRDAAEALIVPRVNGLAYVAKPPMIYWAQLLAARATGSSPELWHLRLVVAVSGVLGVLATYFAGRVIFAGALLAGNAVAGFDGVRVDARLADRAALWGAALVGTGTLFVRSGRIGELDMLLALSCTLAIGAAAWSWETWRIAGRASRGGVLMAAASTVAAALCKDPAVMIIGLGGYAGILLYAAVQPGRRGPSRAERFVPPLVAAAAMLVSLRTVEDPADIAGAAIVGALCGALAWVAVRLCAPDRFVPALRALHGVRAWLVLGLGIATSVLWRIGVSRLIGPAEARSLLGQEIDDNLRVLVASAPLNNLWACLIGVGAGSWLAIFGVLWLVRDRPRLPAGWWTLVAWIGLNFCAFSLLGKGVNRYLTPVWPAIALLGGLTLVSLLAAHPARRMPAWIVAATVVALALGQSWYYAAGRGRFYPELSSRDLALELRAMPGLDTSALYSFEFASPGLESYLGRRIVPVGGLRVNIGMSGGPAITLDELSQRVRDTGEGLLLVPASIGDELRPGSPIVRLARAGFTLTLRPTTAVFRHSGKAPIALYALTLTGPSEPVNDRTASPAP